MAQHALERVIEPAADVIIGRGDEFVIEAEAIEEGAQHRVVVVRETLMGAERIGDARQRLAEMLAEHLLVGDVVGHFAQPIHIVRESDEASRLIGERSEEHTSELQSLMRISYAVFCLKKKKQKYSLITHHSI